jgi:hypothetical protein
MARTFGRNCGTTVRIARFQNCYDKQTEIYTKEGFKFFKDITANDEIATLNSENFIEFHKPIDIQTFDYNGVMYKLSSRSIDQLITPEHYVYASNRYNSKMKYQSIKNLWGRDIRMTRLSNWKGSRQRMFSLPECTMSDGRKMDKYGSAKEINMNDWLSFLGYYLSEGSAFKVKNKDNSTNGYRVVITQAPGKIQNKILKTLRNIGYDPYITNKKEICVTSKQLYNYCKQFGHSREKYIPREFLALDTGHLWFLFNALMDGDGDKNRKR